MWKLLRNSILIAILLAGVFKLVLWYAIQQGASRLVTQLAPLAQVQYAGVTATLGGNVDFSGVSVVVGKAKGSDVWHASSVELETPGALWLARRLLLGNDDLPEHLVVTINGTQAPAAALSGVAPWFGAVSLVPFETLGCGIVSRFSVADYQRMGLNPGAQQQRIDYRFDPAASTLSIAAEMRSPPFSTVTVRGEIAKFDPRALATGSWARLHFGEVNIGYLDTGYLAKRNQFCAQQAGITPAQFVDQHLAAVRALLGDRGVEPGSEAVALYRSLIRESGRVSVLSLPAAGSTLGELLAETPDAMIRRLNLTARRNDTPPVMVRMSFRAPAAPATEVASDATASSKASAPAPAAPAAPATAASSSAVSAVPAVVPAQPQQASAPPVAAKTAAAAPVPRDARETPAAAPVAAKPAAAASSAAIGAVAVRPPAPAPAKSSVTVASATPSVPAKAVGSADKTIDATGLGPSTPPPPEGSTLALVWKPTVDRLEEAPPPPRDYDVLEYSALGGYAGRYVRLLTTAGKKVEGRIISIDATSLSLRIQNSGGTAELQVPRSVIVEIQLPRRRDGSG